MPILRVAPVHVLHAVDAVEHADQRSGVHAVHRGEEHLTALVIDGQHVGQEEARLAYADTLRRIGVAA